MALLTPADTMRFRCMGAVPFPMSQLPHGCVVKLSPDSYFRKWRIDTSPADRVYLSTDFSRLVIPVLESVCIDHNPVRQAAYTWMPQQSATVTWREIYEHFPAHGPKASDYQVVPWCCLQQLVFGWGTVAPIIPRNSQGALLMLGNAGLSVASPSGVTSRGTSKFLVRLSHFPMLGPSTWVLAIPGLEDSDQRLPTDMVIVTVQGY